MCGHKLKPPQQSCTRGKLGSRIVSLMIYFNSLSTVGKISKSVLDQRHKVDTEFNLSRVLTSVVVTQALPIWIRDSVGRKGYRKQNGFGFPYLYIPFPLVIICLLVWASDNDGNNGIENPRRSLCNLCKAVRGISWVQWCQCDWRFLSLPPACV